MTGQDEPVPVPIAGILLLCALYVCSSDAGCGSAPEADDDTGSASDGQGDAPDADHASGCTQDPSWELMPSGTREYLYDVWGSATDDVFAVGRQGTILHFDGADWRPMESGTTRELAAVWGSGPRDVWAVGEDDIRLHFDGVGWSEEGRVPEPAMGENLWGIWGAAADDVWSVGECCGGGYGLVMHFDGADWMTVGRAWTCGDLADIFGVAGGEVFTVGGYSSCDETAIFRLDGDRWSAVGPHRELWADSLTAVWTDSDGSGWAVGMHGVVCLRDGLDWSCGETGETRGYHGVWGLRSDDVFVVGDDGTIRHWDGSTILEWASPTRFRLTDVWGVGEDVVFATGFGGTTADSPILRLCWDRPDGPWHP